MRLGKRGAGTMENFLSVIIAVIGILLIVFVGYKLLDASNVNEKVKSAQTLANEIEAKIGLMNDGDENEFILRGVENWYLVGWSEGDDLDERPDKCFDSSCICVCPGPESESCQENGICRDIDKEHVEVLSHSYEVVDSVGSGTGGVSLIKDYVDRACVRLDSLLFTLNVTKSSESVSLIYDRLSESYEASNCRRS